MLRKLAIAPEKIDLLPVWREAGVYTEREFAALAWAETMIDLAPGAASDEDYAALLRAFTESEAMFLNVAIATINAWNRLGVALRFAPLALRASGR
jgi:alkylhydroperoxidase family enzyme